MFGETIDYWLLRFCVRPNVAMNDEDLDRDAESKTGVNMDQAMHRLAKWNRRLDHRIPLSNHLHYLDIGSGDGDIALAIANASGGRVTGIDIMPRTCITATNNAKRLGFDDRVAFQAADVYELDTSEQFDVLLSHEMIEHVRDPQRFFASISRLLKPGGHFVVAFGPLFHSPWGDHLHQLFRIPIPYRGALFSEQALLRVRTEFFRPSDPVKRFQDIEGGLNKMRFSEFLSYMQEGNWEVELMYINPQFKRFPPLWTLSNLLLKVPILRDYVAASVYAILRKAAD